MGTRSSMEFTPEEVLNNSNMLLKPMHETLHSLPWVTGGNHRVGEVFCETFWIPPFRGGAPLDACPRYVARRQLDHLKQLGYQLFSGFEAEFYITDATGKPVYEGHELFTNSTFSEFEPFLYSMDEQMADAGVDVATMHTEYGDGQFEMALAPKYGIESADQLFLLKQAVKEMSKQHQGWLATFMTKPFLEKSANGLHFSHSLWTIPASDEKTQNVFHDPSAEDGLSTIGRQWIAGLMRHGRGLMALCSPTVNCYRRLGTTWTPNVYSWDIGIKSVWICVKTGSPKATYFENRLPAGAANPYLVLAATVAAGIDGIVNKLECPRPKIRSSAMTANPTQTTKADSVDLLPDNLSESLDALENDKVLCEALSSEFVEWFVSSKRANEIAQLTKVTESNQMVFELEREMYFKVL